MNFLAKTKALEPLAGSDAVLRQIQLPKIDLPIFTGDQLKWEGFRDLFKSLVHNVAGLAPTHKLHYLKASLAGDAADVVANIDISADGYVLAWDELVSRYDNPRVLLATHMRVLLSTTPMTKPSAAEINRLISAVSHASRSFGSLGRPVKEWDDWFVHILVEKLDSSSRLLWESSQSSSKEFPTYEKLKEFLLTRARALDAATPRTATAVSSTRSRRSGNKDEVSSHTTSTGADDKGPPCPICKERHVLRSCAKFKAYTAEQRRDQVRKRKVCFNCLGQGHMVSACPSANRCRHCQEKHHSLLHLVEAASTTTQLPSQFEATAVPDTAGASGEPAKVAALSTSTSGTVLLATAMVQLKGESGRTTTVRALLDSGSESSFISERMAQQLRLSRRRVNVTVSGLQGVTTGRLADPNFDQPAAVDLVLGADVYGMLLDGGVRRGSPGEPAAHSTVFGWVLMGALTESTADTIVAAHTVAVEADLHDDLRRFWQLEELPNERILTPEERQCERLFIETHARDETGRYIVRLPRKLDPPTSLGASRRGALQMLMSTERRLERDPSLKHNYNTFMADYLTLGHMEQVPQHELAADETYYMPHHAVVKKNEPGGKLRVVFNASFRTSTGSSLNDVLFPGPKLQADLWLILTRWRLFQFAFTADIIKMFRQIRIHHDDADLQRILWRADPMSEVQDFRLTTVTYGTASAPYLAIRALMQLAQDEALRFPRGASTLRNNTYVDDILAGANTMEEALDTRRQLVDLLLAGGFQLSKWAASHSALCPNGDQAERLITTAEGIGTLGVIWAPAEDSLRLRAVPPLTSTANPTKRSILSDIARLFDPAGWAAPVIIWAKVFLQDLWMSGLDWDQDLPPPLRTRWLHFIATLPELNHLSLPRWTGASDLSSVELHAFSDASERAYAAVVYMRTTKTNGLTRTALLVAKTKVAPTKPVSIPRLELSGALLAARLLHRVAAGLDLEAHRLHAWIDAKVVLAWLRSHPSRWKPFVANRVAAIQELVPAQHWRHVPTSENPADLATRGITPNELSSHQLWWMGPSWLEASSSSWPPDDRSSPEESEESRTYATATHQQAEENELLLRFSSLSRLIRVSAFCLRFLRGRERSRTSHLSALELKNCLLRWLQIAQRQDFESEVEALSRGEQVQRRSPLSALRPFLGPDGLIRVGGRLQHSTLTYEERHPVILAKRGHLSLLLQQMGQLPVDRVQAARPFRSAGVDYAGPINLKASKGRGIKSFKGYICLFVCMASRAVHLEAVSDLTTGSFLAAFRRLVARRGHCARLSSDNGTNFRGADRELREMFSAASEFYQECRVQLAADGTEWTFIPPSAPHFGGLWEAGVKSAKHHLRRVLGDQLLTYEELSTLLCQVEACLNSRPLYPMSVDPTDSVAITPGHLLIGEAPINIPEPPAPDRPTGGPKLRWELVANMRDHFWRRWSTEYLGHLQQLGKWRTQQDNLQPGALVLIKEDLLPPGKWALGRIRETHPGTDGLVRVVTVETATSRLTRPVTKLCPLPGLQAS
ncbi:transposon polyprotein [Lasius niger]|uniref:Transposon polyprotein n=1 Tax=Lasius niger TaxID=67767 RepID=A0A0J7KMJ0_LASNI|nr:transposon polyprotein [Lasius niger]